MTGGQAHEGGLQVLDIARQTLAENVARAVILSNEPERYRGAAVPAGIDVHSRDDLDEIQRTLRDTAGVTVLIYDQTCAAELRRRRKRNLAPRPAQR